MGICFGLTIDWLKKRKEQNVSLRMYNSEMFFIFNRKTGYKKKLNSFIQFPDVLDMKDHVKNGCTGKQFIFNYLFIDSYNVQARKLGSPT